jgi:hypothetical protein
MSKSYVISIFGDFLTKKEGTVNRGLTVLGFLVAKIKLLLDRLTKNDWNKHQNWQNGCKYRQDEKNRLISR